MSTTVATSANRKRPIGITLLAGILLWIGCGGTLFFPFIARSGGVAYGIEALFGSSLSERWLNFDIWAAATITWLLYVAYAVIGFGLWKLRNWARRSVIVLCALMPVAGVASAWSFRADSLLSAGTLLWSITPMAWMFWYFKRPGVQFAFGNYSAEAGPPPQLSRGKRVVVALAVVASTAGLFILLLLFGIENQMRRTGAYQMAVKQAQASPCARAMMGDSLMPGWFATGEWSEGSTEGTADLSIPMRGSKGKGVLDVSAKKQNGVWMITSLILSNKKGQANLTTLGAPCKP